MRRRPIYWLMAIPVEILFHALSFLQFDRAALKACSESHPFLSQLVEPFLYSHILLRTNSSSDFLSLLFKRPHIAKWIRSLKICVTSPSDRARGLEEISIALPKLLALRKITLQLQYYPFQTLGWSGLPKVFRLAFLDCLRLPSMEDISLIRVARFPFTQILNCDEYKNLKSLSVEGGTHPILAENPVQNISSAFSNVRASFKSLSIAFNKQDAIQGFIDSFITFVPELRSLEVKSRDYDSLPMQLFFASYSNTLTSLCLLVVSVKNSYGYLFDDPPRIEQPMLIIPVALSTLPYLERLTIHSKMIYVRERDERSFFSLVPWISQLFLTKPPSPFRHLTLYFNCFICATKHVQPDFSSSLPILDVICIPLVELLSNIESTTKFRTSPSSIHVNVYLKGVTTVGAGGPLQGCIRPMHIHHFLSSIADCDALKKFVDEDKLTVTPLDVALTEDEDSMYLESFGDDF